MKVIRLVALLVLIAAVAAAFVLFPIREHLQNFLEWIQGLGTWGLVLLGAVYIPACILFVPGSLITLGGGYAFGVIQGTIAISLGSTAGACAAFLTGRFLARSWIEDKVAKNRRFRAIDQAIAHQGLKIVLLTRLSPVFPFNLLNYAFGLTRVRFRDYFWGSWIGMFPGTVMYVYLGSAVGEIGDLLSGNIEHGWEQTTLFFVGLAATVAVTVFVTRLARRALREAIPEED